MQSNKKSAGGSFPMSNPVSIGDISSRISNALIAEMFLNITCLYKSFRLNRKIVPFIYSKRYLAVDQGPNGGG